MRSKEEYAQATLKRLEGLTFDEIQEINFCGHKDYRVRGFKLSFEGNTLTGIQYKGVDLTCKLDNFSEIKDIIISVIKEEEDRILEELF